MNLQKSSQAALQRFKFVGKLFLSIKPNRGISDLNIMQDACMYYHHHLYYKMCLGRNITQFVHIYYIVLSFFFTLYFSRQRGFNNVDTLHIHRVMGNTLRNTQTTMSSRIKMFPYFVIDRN